MPIPISHPRSVKNQKSIAWLRIIDYPISGRIVAGLLETAADGKPLGFSIAHVEMPDCPSTLRHMTRQRLFSELAKALFQTSITSPILLFGLKGEVSAQGFEGFDIGLPTGRVSSKLLSPDYLFASNQKSSFRQLFSWVKNPPEKSSEAQNLMNELLKSSQPFEPLNRMIDGITATLPDQKAQESNSIYGSVSVLSLPSFQEHARMRNINASCLIEESDASAGGSREARQADQTAKVWEALGAAKEELTEKTVNTDLDWESGLMPFQRDGVGALIHMDRLLLSDDMGLGKTIQTIAAIRILTSLGEMDACLVVAPASLLDQWRQELSKWAPELSVIILRGPIRDREWQWKADTNVKLIGYESLVSDQRFVLRKHNSAARTWDAVVLDEAQRIKNRITVSAIVKKIPRARSWALTGTPIENSESELASIMEFVDHASDEDGYGNFYFPGEKLRQRHRDLQLRRKKSEVLLDLPEKLETKLRIDLHPNQQATYDRAEREGIIYLKSLGKEVEIHHILALITRLKQICNFDPKTGESSKLDNIKERIATLTAQGHKALVFSQYKSDAAGVGAIAQGLRQFRPLTLTGDVSIPNRSAIVEEFKRSEEHQVLILSLRVGGQGLNLQEASYVFHMDRWWNPAVERQAEDRSHRMGQTVKVNAIKYTCANTIEQRIDSILLEKQDLFDRLIDDVSIDLSASLTKAELLSLFGL